MGFVVVFFYSLFLWWMFFDLNSLFFFLALSSNKNSNCFYSYFQGFKERNNIIDDYIF